MSRWIAPPGSRGPRRTARSSSTAWCWPISSSASKRVGVRTRSTREDAQKGTNSSYRATSATTWNASSGGCLTSFEEEKTRSRRLASRSGTEKNARRRERGGGSLLPTRGPRGADTGDRTGNDQVRAQRSTASTRGAATLRRTREPRADARRHRARDKCVVNARENAAQNRISRGARDSSRRAARLNDFEGLARAARSRRRRTPSRQVIPQSSRRRLDHRQGRSIPAGRRRRRTHRVDSNGCHHLRCFRRRGRVRPSSAGPTPRPQRGSPTCGAQARVRGDLRLGRGDLRRAALSTFTVSARATIHLATRAGRHDGSASRGERAPPPPPPTAARRARACGRRPTTLSRENKPSSASDSTRNFATRRILPVTPLTARPVDSSPNLRPPVSRSPRSATSAAYGDSANIWGSTTNTSGTSTRNAESYNGDRARQARPSASDSVRSEPTRARANESPRARSRP